MTDENTIDSLISDLWIAHGNARRRAISELVQIGEPAIEPLLKAIQEDDHNESMVDYERRFLRDALVKMGETAFNKLIKALTEKGNVIGGRAAVKTLVLFNDVRAVEPLVRVMLDKRYKQNTRGYAIDALGYFKDPWAFEPLITALRDEDVFIVGHAARALGEYRNRRALGPLNGALSHSGRSQWMDWREVVHEAIKTISNPDYTPSNRGFFINNGYY